MKRFRAWAKARVPASTSNLGAGFDALGLALGLYNEVEARVAMGQAPGLEIQIIGEGASALPRDPRNVIWQAMEKTFRRYRLPIRRLRFSLKFTNRIPLARGLGSSAAAQLGGVLAANALCGNFLKPDHILAEATELEGHPDNVAPSFMGGLCLSAVRGGKVEVLKLKMPADLTAVVCVPDFELSTRKARAVLPKTYSRADAVFNVSRVSLFLGGLFARDYRFLKLGMEDRIHQEYRKKLIPGFDRVLEGGYRAGAWGVALSGAGPSIFALTPKARATAVGQAMRKGFLQKGIQARSWTLPFDSTGARVQCQ